MTKTLELDYPTAWLVMLCQEAFESDNVEAHEYARSVLSICAVTLRHKVTRIPESAYHAVRYLKAHFEANQS